MSCPRCGFAEPGPVECPRCGVVFAKLDRPPPPAPPADPPGSSGPSVGWLEVVLVAALAVSVAVIVSRARTPDPPGHTGPAAAPRRAPPPTIREPVSPPPGPEAVADSFLVPDEPPEDPGSPTREPGSALPPTVAWGIESAGDPALRPEDAEAFASLTLVLQKRSPIDATHLDQAEALHARYPEVPDAGHLLRSLLDEAARQAKERGRSVSALRYLERATDLFPETSSVWLALVRAHQETGAWREVERVARRGLSALRDDSSLHLALARALSMQGRDEEAADLLRRHLLRHDDRAVRNELQRLDRELQSVAGLGQRRSAHFSVRFEGESDDALGEALLKVLEEKYEMLARTLDCEPGRQIPVLLLPRETFRSASDAPEWAGGFYSHSDARIRIGTKDLSPGFVPLDLERMLTHELAHAFIHARTRGAIPDDVNEGLAQYLSGERLGYRLDPARAEVRDGRMKVDDFYDSALSFVEFLLDRYRQARLNELLKNAGETANVDDAFRRTFHQSYGETREEWLKSLR